MSKRQTSLLLDDLTAHLLDQVGTKGPYLRNLVQQHAQEAQSCWMRLKNEGWRPAEIMAVAAAINGTIMDPATLPLSATLPIQLDTLRDEIPPSFNIDDRRWQEIIDACRHETTAYAVYRLALETLAGNTSWSLY